VGNNQSFFRLGCFKETVYGHASEYTGDYNELIYLRARFYAPGMGRFLTRDTWVGDYNRPLSLNQWNYGYGNPVNYTDPSGFIPCTENQQYRYCKLDRGGYLDVEHFKAQKGLAEDVRYSRLPAQFGKPISSGFTLQGYLGYQVRDWLWYSATFYTQLPVDANRLLRDDLLDRMAHGIVLNYDYGFETAQASLPMCYTIVGWFIHCSGFSNEDLPSNYLGILSAVKPLLTFDFILTELGGGQQLEDNDGFPTEEYWGNSWPGLELFSVAMVFVQLILHLMIGVTSRYIMPI
jgi:RHS repeat-associated protein